MNDAITNTISVTTIQHTLQQLLAGYLVEKADSQRDNDTHDIDYWDSACQTIYDVAAVLNIPLEETPSRQRPHKQHPHQPDSMTPDTADVQLSEGSYPNMRYLCKDSQYKS